ncbi:MAG: hypothetical protein HGGPFJEG_00737 [Ignavibacteria bacterium]|nr:hypothetical protein [Ignavibacteria bacterium]
MKSKLLIYVLPVVLTAFLLFGYSIQDDPTRDSAPVYETKTTTSPDAIVEPNQSDTAAPSDFPYPKQFGWVYAGIPNVSGGTVGAMYFNGKWIMNRWNSATLWRYNPNGPGGGPGTIADSNTAYNAGAGAIRDLTAAPDGSGRMFMWGGSGSTALFKLDSMGNRVANYTHTGAAYRAIAWDPNRKGFWSCNFTDNIVLRDTLGTVKRTITATTWGGKYGLAFDSTSRPDSAFLWVWSQDFTVTTDTTNKLVKISLATGLPVATYSFNKGSNIAGGAEAFVKDNKFLIALNFQNYAVAAYNLKDLTPTGGGTITVCRSGIAIPIPDNGTNTNPAVDTINISGIPSGMEIKKVKVTIDTLTHTWIGDLRFWLSKGTVTDTIISRIGYTGSGFGNSCNDFYGTNLIDSTGLISIQNIPTTCNGVYAQATGTFNPNLPLAPFIGGNPNGAYILRISDNAGGDVGELRKWCLTITYGTATGVSNTITTIPSDFNLSQNYPNPFNPSTTINFAIPSTGLVTLKVYDVVGKEVASLVNEVKNAGNHSVKFNASGLSSGVYFYRLQTGDFVDTKKMFLLK